MAIDFPAAPTIGETFTANNVIYTWDGEKWTAGTNADLDGRFVLVAGDTMTGALNVPAGATTTEAPQVQEVVSKAGDTMTGDLTVPNLTVPGNAEGRQFAKAFGRVGSSSGAIAAGYNCTSVKVSTGIYRITFDNTFSNNYSVCINVELQWYVGWTQNITDTSFEIVIRDCRDGFTNTGSGSPSTADSNFSFVVFR